MFKSMTPARRGILLSVFIPMLMAGLLTTGCGTKVSRIDVNEIKDLSGAWNDTDSRLVSEEMINDMLERPWIRTYSRQSSRPPTVIVGTIRNLSSEHINLNTFVGDIERAMINSGRVTFVASSQERQEIRGERKDQDINAREDTRKAMGRELGADFMLKGSINTIIDMEGRTQVRYYQVDLTLISLTDNRKVWLGQKKIKKLVKNSRLRY
ncbi:MAG: penicillin-binding protein activator LpoB [Mariprofundaceae bacterium]|nr:penicillin-binding protein activator LpoB [Mariprofundaceae bacterium]